MSKGNLDGRVKPVFVPVFSKFGYNKISEQYFAESFGDEILIYSSGKLMLRFSTDRGDLRIEIKAQAPGDDWIDLQTYLEFCGFVPIGVCGCGTKP